MKNQSTYELKFQADLSDLLKQLNTAKKSLEVLFSSGKAPKGLEKTFEKLTALLGQLIDKTGQPLDLKGLSGTQKDLNTVSDGFRSILRLLGDFNNLSEDVKISFISEDATKHVQEVTAALDGYQKALSIVGEKEKQLTAQKKSAEKENQKIKKAQEKITGLEGKKEKAEATRNTKQGQLDAAVNLGDKADPVKIAKLRGEIGQLDTEISSLEKSIKSASTELVDLQKGFQSSSATINQLENSIKTTNISALKDMKTSAKELGVSLEGLNGHNASKQMEILSDRLKEFKNTALTGGEAAFETIKDGCEKGVVATKKFSNEVQEASDSVKEMDESAARIDSFKARIKSFLGLSGAAHLLNRALRDAIQTIAELDSTMSEMAVVTDLTVGDYWDQLPEYSKRASDLGVSTNSAYKAATLYYQQGLKTNEVTAISTQTLKMAKIAGLDAAEATDKMTAALRGFNMELNETSAKRVADVYSELAAITAADVNEISTAMTKTASIASSAGMEFETTAAFLSQIIETTRESAETAGTAMKTVVARFQELKKSPEEISEVDGEIVDANAIETALRSVSVSLRDASGQFRELDDVFLELSSKWDGLDKNTQRYIATVAAGSRQQSRFIAMMSDYGRTQELVTAANNSAGASQKQFEKTMESLSAKVEKLKNAWHEFTMGIMNNDLLKFGVDILTKFLEVVNKTTKGFGGLTSSFMKIVSVMGVFKLGKKIFEKFEEPITKLYSKVVDEAGKAGFNSGKAFKEGLEKGLKGEKTHKKEQVSNFKKKDERKPQNQSGEKQVILQEGYYKDANGRVHRPNGHFAKKGEGIVILDANENGAKAGLNKVKQGVETLAGTKNDLGKEREVLNQLMSEKSPEKRRQELIEAEEDFAMLRRFGASQQDLNKAEQRVNVARASVQEYDSQRQKVNLLTNEGKDQIKSGLKQTGKATLKIADEATGFSKVFYSNTSKRLKNQFLEENENKRKRYVTATANFDAAANKQYENPEEYQKALEELSEATKEYDAEVKGLTKDQQEMVASAKIEDMQNMANGLGQMGKAAMGAGMAVSVLGGVFSSLGLEDVGEIVTGIGTGFTMLGAVLTTIPSLFSAISAAASAAGISISVALGVVTAVVAAVAIIAGAVIGISTYIKNNSPEKQVERATKALEEAEEVADRTKQAYEGLKSSIEDLGNKYQAMDNMVKGTKEWNEALQESNSAVLDLIDKYPELASQVKRVEGQLKIDTESDEVQNIIKQYEAQSIVAKGSVIGAKQRLNDANQAKNFADLEAVSKVANQRGWQAAGTSVGVGAGTGAIVGGIGAAVGTVVGGIGAAIAGPIASASARTDEELQKATEKLAKSVESGETELEFDAIKDFLILQGVAADEAKVMAKAFSENTKELRDFGKSVLASEAANEAYYSAMAMNAQQMLNMGIYSTDEVSQMNNAIDSDRMKAIKDKAKQEIEGLDKEETKEAKEKYARETYGEDAIVEGNKITYYVDGEEKTKTFKNDEAWVNAIAAAEATKDAANAMSKVPEAIDQAVMKFNELSPGKGSIIEKGLTDSNKLTQNELNEFKEAIGYSVDSEGKSAVASDENSALKKVWDANKENLEDIYGDFETFIEEYKTIVVEQEIAWKNIEDKAEKLGFNTDENGQTVISNMSSGAANTWVNLLSNVMPTGTEGVADGVNDALGTFLAGKSQEDVDAIMSQIGAIDFMDAGAWDQLTYTLENLGVVVDSSDSSLQAFIEQAKNATNAIYKVDFTNFNKQINQTIELLNKAQEGARKYSEDEYKSFISANKGLKNDFVQVGDNYVYLGTAMEDLTAAIKENTVSKLQEANHLISAQIGMSRILENGPAISKESNISDQRTWLLETVTDFAKEGYDVADLGIAGLSLDTDFSDLDDAVVKSMVEQMLNFKGQSDTLTEQRDKQMRDANIATYTLNSAAFNAQKGITGGEWADEHREALVIQAIDAGVGEVMIQGYQNAAKEYEQRLKEIEDSNMSDEEKATARDLAESNFREVSQSMIDMINTVEQNEKKEEEISSLLPLAEKVTAAIEKERQDTIDKLSEVNDSINSANDLLISKIQEQINSERQARENEKAENEITDLYSQQAYLGMDTSGANNLAMLDNKAAIEQAEQEYEDRLIDQAIQGLQDANAEAAEQRERQINLLQQQLDYEKESGLIADQAATIVRESIERVAAGENVSNTRLNDYLRADIAELGGMQKEEAVANWSKMIMEAIQGAKPEEGNQSGTKDVSGNQLTDENSGGNGSGGGNPKPELDDLQRQKEKRFTNAQNALTSLAQKYNNTRNGASDITKDAEYQSIINEYTAAKESAGKTEAKDAQDYLREQVNQEITGGSIDGVSVSGLNQNGLYFGDTDELTIKLDGQDYKIGLKHRRGQGASSDITENLNQIVGGSPKDEWVAMYDNQTYMYVGGNRNAWFPIEDSGFNKAYKQKLQAYKTGGLADFTGPAWLDGTPSKPEYILNATQTERFFSLIDVLESFDKSEKASENRGDNYFDININVEKLENDYDVEQVANKIRGIIYEDATYRNVNVINRIR